MSVMACTSFCTSFAHPQVHVSPSQQTRSPTAPNIRARLSQILMRIRQRRKWCWGAAWITWRQNLHWEQRCPLSQTVTTKSTPILLWAKLTWFIGKKVSTHKDKTHVHPPSSSSHSEQASSSEFLQKLAPTSGLGQPGMGCVDQLWAWIQSHLWVPKGRRLGSWQCSPVVEPMV